MAFSQQHADAACNFFEVILKHTADEYYGKPFLLCPWEEEALVTVFGNLDDDGNRVIELVFLEVPKKAGKTQFVAGIVLLVLVLTTTPGCEVYGAAAATRQALNVYRAACKMVEQSPILSKQLRIMRGTNRIIKRKDPDSFYAAVAADGDMGDGVNPAFVVADEVHRWKTRKQLENWDVLSNGGITRRQTLTFAITTAGVRSESPLAWRLHTKTQRIKEGLVQDPRFFGRIYAADPKDDPGDPKTWIKANPSLIPNGGFLPVEKVREKYESAVAEGDLTSFRRYFLNLWDEKENRAIEMQRWDACRAPWQAAGLLARAPEDAPDACRPLPRDLLAHFIDRKCWAGVDLSMTTDFTAVAFLFPCEAEDEYDVLPFFWLPEKNVRKREIKDGMPYRQWAEQGFLELCEGEVINYRDVRKRLEWGDRMFDLQEIAFDPYNSQQISTEMIEDGHHCIDVKQGFTTLNEPTKKLLELIVRGAIHHGNHPALRWNASCACLVSSNDLVMFAKPHRERESSRIDGIAATVNALKRALPAAAKSAYSDPSKVAI